MQDYKKLNVWKKAHDSVIFAYQATSTFPKDELYGLTSQIRRAAVSIPANIAEGCGKGGNAELHRFLQISLGSTNELEYYLMLASELKYLNKVGYDGLNSQLTEVKRMLISLIQKTQT
jgi:four helix bundle protein